MISKQGVCILLECCLVTFQQSNSPIIIMNTLKSIHNNHNNAWDNLAKSPITNTRFPIFSSSFVLQLFVMFEGKKNKYQH